MEKTWEVMSTRTIQTSFTMSPKILWQKKTWDWNLSYMRWVSEWVLVWVNSEHVWERESTVQWLIDWLFVYMNKWLLIPQGNGTSYLMKHSILFSDVLSSGIDASWKCQFFNFVSANFGHFLDIASCGEYFMCPIIWFESRILPSYNDFREISVISFKKTLTIVKNLNFHWNITSKIERISVFIAIQIES